MSELTTAQREHLVADQRSVFGFWVYIMTDCILFAALFATYAVLHNSIYGGTPGHDLFELPGVLAETLILLTSSFTMGLAMLAVRQRRRQPALGFLGLTFLLGLAFLALELIEFHHLASTGNSWQRSGFLSSFFVLVGTHGLHILIGLIWIAAMMTKLVKRGFTRSSLRRLTMLSLFWHFLDIVWIFIFTIVYLMGVGV